MTTVHVPVQLDLLIPDRKPLPIPGDLCWNAADPTDVWLRMDSPGRPTAEWLIGRNVFAAGLHGTGGEMDVVVHPHPDEAHIVQIDLSSPHGEASLTLQRQLLLDFLQATFLVLPADRESAVIEAELDALDWASPVGDDTGGAQ